MPLTFFDLPGELRNCIYELYLANYKVGIIVLHNEHCQCYLAPSLAPVSRQIRPEFLSLWLWYTRTPERWYDMPIRTLKVFVDDFDFAPLRKFLHNRLNQHLYRFTEVEVTFRFTNVSKVASHPKVVHEWQRMDFKPVSGTYGSQFIFVRSLFGTGRNPVSTQVRLPPKVTCRAQLDMAGLGGDNRDRASKKRAVFRPSSEAFTEIVQRAKEAVKPGGRTARERSFRTWLKLELFEAEGKRQTTTASASEGRKPMRSTLR